MGWFFEPPSTVQPLSSLGWILAACLLVSVGLLTPLLQGYMAEREVRKATRHKVGIAVMLGLGAPPLVLMLRAIAPGIGWEWVLLAAICACLAAAGGLLACALHPCTARFVLAVYAATFIFSALTDFLMEKLVGTNISVATVVTVLLLGIPVAYLAPDFERKPQYPDHEMI